ncbi:HNH endonuclease [Streptomyces sp. NPDC059118]|uniref:HNH endonuclease n=1 Tax=unclassified Streptomyces TaxID=2593676 RepID=UPI003696156E
MAMDEPRRKPSIVKVAEYVASVGEGERFTKLDLFANVPDVAQADRRMRDLRPMGWKIDNYKVNSDLKPDEYLLVEIGTRIDQGEPVPKTVRKNITGPKRRRIMERDGHACQVCGVHAGAEYWDEAGRNAVLSIGHIIPVSDGGNNDDENLRAECQRCNDESRNNTKRPPTPGEVLIQVTALKSRDKKKRLYAWMAAGRRTVDDVDDAFTQWSRLSRMDRLDVMAKLGSQVIKTDGS